MDYQTNNSHSNYSRAWCFWFLLLLLFIIIISIKNGRKSLSSLYLRLARASTFWKFMVDIRHTVRARNKVLFHILNDLLEGVRTRTCNKWCYSFQSRFVSTSILYITYTIHSSDIWSVTQEVGKINCIHQFLKLR